MEVFLLFFQNPALRRDGREISVPELPEMQEIFSNSRYGVAAWDLSSAKRQKKSEWRQRELNIMIKQRQIDNEKS